MNIEHRRTWWTSQRERWPRWIRTKWTAEWGERSTGIRNPSILPEEALTVYAATNVTVHIKTCVFWFRTVNFVVGDSGVSISTLSIFMQRFVKLLRHSTSCPVHFPCAEDGRCVCVTFVFLLSE